MFRYAIIIPAYNEEAFLPATLSGARVAMDGIVDAEGEIIVVDNHSTDRTAAVARECGADQVVYEEINQISRARNTGARSAMEKPECDYLIFLDADTHLPALLLERAIDELRSGKVCGGGAMTISDQPLPFHVDRLLATWNWFARHLGMAAGSFVFCRRDAFEKIGGFDEKVYAGEEVWLSRKLRRWGRKRGLAFRVLTDPPIVTSGRKSEWFSAWDFARQLLLLLFCPWTTRSQKLCRLWYRRPVTPP
ncbi:MAG: glycosyltransferase [Verrucomicrobiae bacterium]|nr:glycosyltransferase [Verrucomicrobiae bacterium]